MGALCLDQGAAADRRPRSTELEAIRRPFVFRKYLDFGAINAMRDLHAQIRREVATARHGRTTSSSAPAASARSSSSPRCSSSSAAAATARCRSSRRCKVLKLLVERGQSRRRDAAANWPPPTISCAGSNTACNTSTTRRPTACRTSRGPGPDRRRPWASADFEALLMELDDHRADGQPPLRGGVRRPRTATATTSTPLWNGAGDGDATAAELAAARLRRPGGGGGAPGRHPRRQPLPADAGHRSAAASTPWCRA